jgi:arylsulfatase A-like enzyme
MLGALFCTLAVKFFHACRTGLFNEYLRWISADLVVLLGVELALSLLCLCWPRKGVVRAAVLTAAIFCTWSVCNAGWLIGRGTQILPSVLVSLVFDPVNRLSIIGHHLVAKPVASVVLLGPSAVALVFLFMVLAHPVVPARNNRKLAGRILVYVLLAGVVFLVGTSQASRTSSHLASKGVCYNSQIKALTSLFSGRVGAGRADRDAQVGRRIPAYDEVNISLQAEVSQRRYNVVIVILEGVGCKHTSLYESSVPHTPYLRRIAESAAVITNTRPPLTHSTKAFFSILTGWLPSITGDYVEALPVGKAYASIATILRDRLGYRTAFFQSAKGNFECRPGLVHNLGFEKYWAREYANNPEAYLGYLASDEFIMLEPITKWIREENRPFLLTLVLSATHDTYEVPQWYGENDGEPIEKYRRTIAYTDSFIKALDEELERLGCGENTILCIIGDHGEAFGEHQRFGHDLIPFDEALRVVWLLRAPGLIGEGVKVTAPAGSVDVTPTILRRLGFDISTAGFDGIDIFTAEAGRRVYFSGWVEGTAAGYVEANKKYIYDPTNQIVVVYDLQKDPEELQGKEITGPEAEKIITDVTEWKKKTFIPTYNWGQTKEVVLFDFWRVYRLRSREPSAKYLQE